MINDRDISAVSVVLNILAVLGFLIVARTPPETTTDMLGIAVADFGVFGTVLAAIAIQKEWLRVLSAVLVLVTAVAVRVVLLQG
jgi:predicted Kef-type K+ transport protein